MEIVILELDSEEKPVISGKKIILKPAHFPVKVKVISGTREVKRILDIKKKKGKVKIQLT